MEKKIIPFPNAVDCDHIDYPLPDGAKLTLRTREEWFDVMRRCVPELEREAFEQAWRAFQMEKAKRDLLDA